MRLIVGHGFIAHGYAKVLNGPDHFAASLHALGVPAAHVMAWATIAIELAGGLGVLLGVNLLYLAALATLVLGGPGPLALDRRFTANRRRQVNP